MKPFYIAFIFFIILCFNIEASAYTRIYLLSDIDLEKENLVVSDICKMEGDNINLISNVVIPSSIYSDGLIESAELMNLLSRKLDGKLFIFGTGVQVRKKAVNFEAGKVINVLVKKGQVIGILVRKNGVSIEMKGKALADGAENDEIEIKLPSGVILKGRIISEKQADIVL